MERVRLRGSPNTNLIYLVLLALLTVGFYVLLIVMAASAVAVFFGLLYWTQSVLPRPHSVRSVEMLVVGYMGGAYLLLTVARCCLVRVGGDPLGVKADSVQHAQLFELVRRVAERVGARTICDVYITPDAHVGVWEERAIFMPPGAGRRKVVIGMGALSALTLEQFQCVLAHEYGHFSHRDVSFARIIYRVNVSNNELLANLSTGRTYAINPYYWIFHAYISLYNRVSASFLRRREINADRFAAEAYGRMELAEALVATHIEGSFFREVGLRQVVELAKRRQGVDNLYHYVGVTRRIYAHQCADSMDRALGRILGETTGTFDRHPSLNERLAMLGVHALTTRLPELPSMPEAPDLDCEVHPDVLIAARKGPRSAAESLFGEDLGLLQRELSDLLANRYADALCDEI